MEAHGFRLVGEINHGLIPERQEGTVVLSRGLYDLISMLKNLWLFPGEPSASDQQGSDWNNVSEP